MYTQQKALHMITQSKNSWWILSSVKAKTISLSVKKLENVATILNIIIENGGGNKV